jgi:hypothetical protein
MTHATRASDVFDQFKVVAPESFDILNDKVSGKYAIKDKDVRAAVCDIADKVLIKPEGNGISLGKMYWKIGKFFRSTLPSWLGIKTQSRHEATQFEKALKNMQVKIKAEEKEIAEEILKKGKVMPETENRREKINYTVKIMNQIALKINRQHPDNPIPALLPLANPLHLAARFLDRQIEEFRGTHDMALGPVRANFEAMMKIKRTLKLQGSEEDKIAQIKKASEGINKAKAMAEGIRYLKTKK